MIRNVLIVVVFVAILGGLYAVVNSSQVQLLLGSNQPATTQPVAVKPQAEEKTTPTIAPVDTSDQALESDYTALEKELTEMEKLDASLTAEIGTL